MRDNGNCPVPIFRHGFHAVRVVADPTRSSGMAAVPAGQGIATFFQASISRPWGHVPDPASRVNDGQRGS